MSGMYFAFRSGAEHRQLRHDPYQIELVERPGERAYLRYTKDVKKKNKAGGLKGRKMKPKVVFHHANEQDPSQCFVNLFKMYNSLCPKGRPKDAFYLQPLPKPSPDCWFSNKPIGYNKLDGTVARLQECWNPWVSHKPLSSCYCSNQIISSWSRRTASYGANWTSKLGRCAQLQANIY